MRQSASRTTCRAALEMLAGRLPADSPIGPRGLLASAAGYPRASPTAVPALPGAALIAPPLRLYDLISCERVAVDTRCCVAGNRDHVTAPWRRSKRVGMRLGHPRRRSSTAREHFFFGKLFPLGEAVERWLRTWTSRPARL